MLNPLPLQPLSALAPPCSESDPDPLQPFDRGFLKVAGGAVFATGVGLLARALLLPLPSVIAVAGVGIAVVGSFLLLFMVTGLDADDREVLGLISSRFARRRSQ